MAHSDELARLRDAVVEAAKVWRRPEDGKWNLANGMVEQAVDALLAAEAATCGKCEGRGRTPATCTDGVVRYDGCPDCGGTGRKREDRFRDDSATTPEGSE